MSAPELAISKRNGISMPLATTTASHKPSIGEAAPIDRESTNAEQATKSAASGKNLFIGMLLDANDCPCSRHEQANDPVALVHHEQLSLRPDREPQVGTRRGRLALRRVLLLNQLEQRLRRALVVEQDAADRILAPFGQVVRADVEDLTAGIVAEDQLVLKLFHRAFAIGVDAGDRRPPQQRI